LPIKKIASGEARLKGEAYLPQKELIRKDAFPYQSVVIILDRSALEIQIWIRIMP
jgi:hypothetical protein